MILSPKAALEGDNQILCNEEMGIVSDFLIGNACPTYQHSIDKPKEDINSHSCKGTGSQWPSKRGLCLFLLHDGPSRGKK